MSKARRKGFTFIPDNEPTIIHVSKAGMDAFNQAVQDVTNDQLQKKGYDKLTNQYDVTKEDIDRVVNEVFSEIPEQRFFFYWTEEHYKMFDRAMREYMKENGYD